MDEKSDSEICELLPIPECGLKHLNEGWEGEGSVDCIGALEGPCAICFSALAYRVLKCSFG